METVVVKPSKPAPTAPVPLTPSQILIKATGLAMVFLAVLLIITGIVLGVVFLQKFNQFIDSAEISRPELMQSIQAGWKTQPLADNNHKNILILGVDTLATRGNAPPLTDSMILSSINLQTGQISTLPLPRDLWSDAYQTKINALYYYGLEKYPGQPEKFPQEVVAELTGLPIHHVLVLSMDQVAELIDLVDGIQVAVPVAFIDEKFPRTDVDVTLVTDPELLYETLEFQAGESIMDGATALKYMRSRQGNNDQNSDQARSHRQQLVIQALMAKLSQRQLLTNPQLMGQLYRYYLDNFGQYLSVEELVAIAKWLWPVRSQIALSQAELAIDEQSMLNPITIPPTGFNLAEADAKPQAVIFHPPLHLYQNQWVYVFTSQTDFHQEVVNKLY